MYKLGFEEKEEPTFYEKLKDQLDKIFDDNPEEEYLEKIIPKSKWVKVGTVAEMEAERALERYHNHPVVRTLNLLLKDNKQWRGRMKELIEEADALSIDITDTPQKLVTTIKGLEDNLYYIDHIKHYTISKGKGSDIHIFEKE